MLRSETEAATEKEKDGSVSSSVDGNTKSRDVLLALSAVCSRVEWRVILRFFWEDVMNVSCLCSSGVDFLKWARVEVARGGFGEGDGARWWWCTGGGRGRGHLVFGATSARQRWGQVATK